MNSVNSYISIQATSPGSQQYKVTLNEVDLGKKVTTTALNKLSSSREEAEISGRILAGRLKKEFIMPEGFPAAADTLKQEPCKVTHKNIDPKREATTNRLSPRNDDQISNGPLAEPSIILRDRSAAAAILEQGYDSGKEHDYDFCDS